jgi:hypothetical protein
MVKSEYAWEKILAGYEEGIVSPDNFRDDLKRQYPKD